MKSQVDHGTSCLQPLSLSSDQGSEHIWQVLKRLVPKKISKEVEVRNQVSAENTAVGSTIPKYANFYGWYKHV